jgi:hypothetical protein
MQFYFPPDKQAYTAAGKFTLFRINKNEVYHYIYIGKKNTKKVQ